MKAKRGRGKRGKMKGVRKEKTKAEKHHPRGEAIQLGWRKEMNCELVVR